MQSNKKSTQKQNVSISFVMPFGKYRGKTLLDISEQDPGYILWLNAKNIYYVDAQLLIACKAHMVTPDFDG